MTDPVKVTPEQAAAILEAEHPVIYDTRPANLFATGHIPGAVNVPLDDLNADTAKKVSDDPDKPILAYCNTGQHSSKAVQELKALGYTNIYDLDGGLAAYHGEMGDLTTD